MTQPYQPFGMQLTGRSAEALTAIIERLKASGRAVNKSALVRVALTELAKIPDDRLTELLMRDHTEDRRNKDNR